jgi:hypothetical protein
MQPRSSSHNGNEYKVYYKYDNGDKQLDSLDEVKNDFNLKITQREAMKDRDIMYIHKKNHKRFKTQAQDPSFLDENVENLK